MLKEPDEKWTPTKRDDSDGAGNAYKPQMFKGKRVRMPCLAGWRRGTTSSAPPIPSPVLLCVLPCESCVLCATAARLGDRGYRASVDGA